MRMKEFFGHMKSCLEKISASPYIGIFYGVISTILLAMAHFASQLAIKSTDNMPCEEVAYVRSIGHVVMLTPFLLLFKSRVLYGSEKWVHLGLMALTGFMCYIVMAYVLQLVPLSTVLTISATCPLFANAMSVCVLKEQCMWVDPVLGTLSVIGVVLIARPSFIFGGMSHHKQLYHHANLTEAEYDALYGVGCGVAILFAMSRALYLVLGRKWAKDAGGQKLDTIITVFYPSVMGVVFTPTIMVLSGHTFKMPKEVYGSCSLFSVGILSALGLMCLMKALKTQTATTVGIIRNLEVIWAFVLQYLVLGFVPDWLSALGSIVIAAATIAASFRTALNDMFKKSPKDYLLGGSS